MEVKDAEYGLVFVHGIVGNNRIFDFLRPLIQRGVEERWVALDGHGGDALDFSRTSMAKWKQQVASAVAELRSRCRRIIGIGHSMGCLLLMDCAARGLFCGLILMNPPMVIRPRLSLLTNAAKVATGRLNDDPVAQAAKESYGVSLDFNPLHYYGWPARYIELFREIRRVGKTDVPHIDCRIEAFLSLNDEMVSAASASVLRNAPCASVTILNHSTHYYYSDSDKLMVLKILSKFFELVGK